MSDQSKDQPKNEPNSQDEPGIGEARYGQLCEYVFGEMGEAERAAFELELANDEELQREHAQLLATAEGVKCVLPAEKLSDAMRTTLSRAAEAGTGKTGWGFRFLPGGQGSGLLQVAAALILFIGLAYGIKATFLDQGMQAPEDLAQGELDFKGDQLARLEAARLPSSKAKDLQQRDQGAPKPMASSAPLLSARRAQPAPAEPKQEEAPAAKELQEELLAFAEAEGKPGQLQAELQRAQLTPEARQKALRSTVDDTRAALKKIDQEAPGSQQPLVASAPEELRAFSTGAELSDAAEAPGLVNSAAPPETLSVQRSEDSEDSSLAGAGGITPFVGNRSKATDPTVTSQPVGSFELTASKGLGSGGEGNFRGAGDTVPPAGAQPLGAGPGSPGPAIVSGSSVAGLADFEAARRSNLEGKRVARARRQFVGGKPMGFWEEFDRLGLGRRAGEPDQQLTPNASKTGSSEFFLGREAADEDEKDVKPERRAIPTREAVQEVTRQLIFECTLRPEEAPSDMFFRAWGEHPFRSASEEPISTFGADVDTASYTLARRTLRAGRLPIKEQVRSEEFLNYFRADQPAPEKGKVFGLHLESAPSQFHTDPMVDLLRVTLRGQDMQDYERKPLALTLVIDVSGSMDEPQRMPLVKRSLALLLTQLTYADNVSIVAFSTQATVLSELTSAANRGALEDAIFKLSAQGGTNIQAGITTGFDVAAKGMVEGAVNRVILLSDGVGNIGETDQARILEQVEAFRQKGIYLNTIGVGMGDHNDHFLEQLADRGDGQCQYFDSAREAEKVLVNDLTKTLQPIARDVKIQVEFDPRQVESYRQIGYENRAIANRDFRNDAVDAGEVNAGHQVTALYEVVRHPGARSDQPLATARVRYKLPFVAGASELQKARNEVATEISSTLLARDQVPSARGASWGYRRSMLVAQFAECLRRSIHARRDSLQILQEEVQALARETDDQELFELRDLVELAVPLLIDEAELLDQELLEMVDALRLLNYESARREQLRGDREPDLKQDEIIRRKIEKLEKRIASLLLRRAGHEEPERLQHLGYSGADEER